MNLRGNRIGDQSTEHLANGLQQNKVAFLTSFNLPYNYSFIITTDTYNTGSQRERNRSSRRWTSCKCITAKQSHISHLIWLIIQLLIRPFTDTNNTWTQCKPDRWTRRPTSCECIAAKQGNIFSFQSNSHTTIHSSFSQTLTTLELGWNIIGAQGAKHLATALCQNEVVVFISLGLSCNYGFVILTDAHNTGSHSQPNRCSRGRTYCESIATKQGNFHLTRPIIQIYIHNFRRCSQYWIFLSTESVFKALNILRMHYSKTKYHFSFHSTLPYNYVINIFTGTHYTGSYSERNWWWRFSTSCDCIATKQSNIFTSLDLPYN